MTIFITGGAGYIGSHLTKHLTETGIFPTVFDNFTGENLFPKINGAKYINLSLDSDEAEGHLVSEFQKTSNNIVIHLAGLKSVEKSMANPEVYNRANFNSTEKLLKAMQVANLDNIIFASSAAVYGGSTKIVSEENEANPLSYYGKVKFREEKLISDIQIRKPKHFSILRFFNVVGAASIELREQRGGNIFPMFEKCIKNNEIFKIFGNDYQTYDGTCVRDYIDVRDVAYAISRTVQEAKNKNLGVLNISSGRGTSVLELVNLLSAQLPLVYEYFPRRDGDIPELVGRNLKAKRNLKWSPQFSIEQSLASSFSKNLE
jgi:UDP-glucose 4-epimerase